MVGWEPARQVRSALLTLLLLGIYFAQLAVAAQDECLAQEPNGAVWVTADCIDPLYQDPVIDGESDVDGSHPHHIVSGHFNGTTIKFNFYFPPSRQWDGRFFQQLYPTSDENASDDVVAFGWDNGGYTVQATGISGYRHYAATAKLSKVIAAAYYGQKSSHRIYGYVYGGSGGSFQTVGAVENTVGVWDGAVPFVQAVPISIPDVPGSRALAGMVLRSKRAQIADAVQPGGSGDPFAPLNTRERAMLHEITTMGLPLRKWEDFDMTTDGFTISVLAPTIQALDPTFSDDFWSKPGYLGTEKSELGDIVRSALIYLNASVEAIRYNVTGSPVGVILQGLPNITDIYGIQYNLYDANGTSVIGQLQGTLEAGTAEVNLTGSSNNQTILDTLHIGQKVELDNHWYIAAHAYYRYKLPTESGFYEFDQFVDASGIPLYPQRSVDAPTLVAMSVSGGGNYSGKIMAKVIVIDNLWDSDAWACHADWYRSRVQQALGDRFDDNYRIYYNDHVDHNFGAVDPPRTAYLVDYSGIVYQALLDVSQWVEKDVTPAESTQYTISDSQIVVPATAAERRGIQPVVNLTADGAVVAKVRAGSSVVLKTNVQVPPQGGRITSLEWDPLGTGIFDKACLKAPGQDMEVELKYKYQKPGVYFPGLKATSQRQWGANSTSPTVSNLGRARVIVY